MERAASYPTGGDGRRPSGAARAEREKRLDGRDHASLVLWAADCAEHVLPYFEEKYPKDDRPRNAVEAGRAWARGETATDEARAAAFAAHAAARAAGHAAATAHVAAHAACAANYAVKAATGAAVPADLPPTRSVTNSTGAFRNTM